MPKLLGETQSPNMTIPTDQLGAPGVRGSIEIVPVFSDPNGGAPSPRRPTYEPRDFEVKAKLTRFPTDLTLQGDFGPADGSSYMMIAANHEYIEVEDGLGVLRLDKNAQNELSMVSGIVTTDKFSDAYRVFTLRLSGFIDRISYLASIPVYIDLVVAKDKLTEVQSIFFVSPPRSCTIKSGGETLQTELAPVYALYREAQNAESPYYRVLCLFKIMEGLLGSLRIGINKRAKTLDIVLSLPKAIVPSHPDVPSELEALVGKPIKSVFDTFFQKQYRDAMAHFNLRNNAPLNVSDPSHIGRFQDVAFMANLCARVLIQQHEQALEQLQRT